jgi:hypothetical protein
MSGDVATAERLQRLRFAYVGCHCDKNTQANLQGSIDDVRQLLMTLGRGPVRDLAVEVKETLQRQKVKVDVEVLEQQRQDDERLQKLRELYRKFRGR